MTRKCLFVALAIVMAVPSCRKQETPKEQTIRVRVALGSAPVTLDPHYSNESVCFTISSNIYETLVRTDAELNLLPSLAVRWTNPDDTRWVFDLDPRARFQNGRLCTAEDVVYSLERARNDPHSDWKGSLASVDRIEAWGPHRVMLHTHQPFPLLLRNLIPIAIVQKGATSLETRPLGTGPYEFESINYREGYVKLKRWAGYRGPLPQVSEATFSWIPDDGARLEALKKKQVDVIADPPPNSVGPLSRMSGVRMYKVPSLRVLFLSFDEKRDRTPYANTPKNPFRDVRVRRAVLQAIDRKRIVQEVLPGLGDEAREVVAPPVFGYDPGIRLPGYNLEEARALIKSAGYEGGFSVTLDAPRNAYPGDSAIADLVAQSLKQIGVRVQLNKMEKQDLFRKLAVRDTSFYMLSWNCLSADAQEIFTFLLHTPDPARGYGNDNSGAYSNPVLDRIAEEAEHTMDLDKRLMLLKQGVHVAVDDVAWVPMVVQTYLYAGRDSFTWSPREDRVILFSDFKVAENPH